MLNLADRCLLGRSKPAADLDMRWRRIEGRPSAGIVCFLPWRTPFRVARRIGLVPRDFAACYELPAAIVSASPWAIGAAVRGLVGDACQVIDGRVGRDRAIVIGYSIGTLPASVVAGRLGVKLLSIASADRGDLMIWESRAARDVRRRAQALGQTVGDFAQALDGLNPVEQIAHIGAGSIFVSGARDLFIPAARRAALADAVRRSPRRHVVMELAQGHVGTLVIGGRLQRRLLGGGRHATSGWEGSEQ